jgi:hypothetical protein
LSVIWSESIFFATNFRSIPATKNLLVAEPGNVRQTADAVYRTGIRHSVSLRIDDPSVVGSIPNLLGLL